MRYAYRILKENKGRICVTRIVDNVINDELGNFIRNEYPDINPQLICLALSALCSKGYTRLDLEEGVTYYSIAKELDF